MENYPGRKRFGSVTIFSSFSLNWLHPPPSNLTCCQGESKRDVSRLFSILFQLDLSRATGINREFYCYRFAVSNQYFHERSRLFRFVVSNANHGNNALLCFPISITNWINRFQIWFLEYLPESSPDISNQIIRMDESPPKTSLKWNLKEYLIKQWLFHKPIIKINVACEQKSDDKLKQRRLDVIVPSFIIPIASPLIPSKIKSM